MHFLFEGKDGRRSEVPLYPVRMSWFYERNLPVTETQGTGVFLCREVSFNTCTWSQIKIFLGLWNFALNTGFRSIQVPIKSRFPVLFYFMLSLSKRVEVHHPHGSAVSHVFILNVSVLYLHVAHNFNYADSVLLAKPAMNFII